MSRRNVLKDQTMCCANGPSDRSPGPTVPPRTISLGLEQAYRQPLSRIAPMPRGAPRNDYGDCGRARYVKKAHFSRYSGRWKIVLAGGQMLVSVRAWNIRPWAGRGWGCQDLRLSRDGRNPRRRHAIWHFRLTSYRREPSQDA